MFEDRLHEEFIFDISEVKLIIDKRYYHLYLFNIAKVNSKLTFQNIFVFIFC